MNPKEAKEEKRTQLMDLNLGRKTETIGYDLLVSPS
jgi:hypothetical protein